MMLQGKACFLPRQPRPAPQHGTAPVLRVRATTPPLPAPPAWRAAVRAEPLRQRVLAASGAPRTIRCLSNKGGGRMWLTGPLPCGQQSLSVCLSVCLSVRGLVRQLLPQMTSCWQQDMPSSGHTAGACTRCALADTFAQPPFPPPPLPRRAGQLPEKEGQVAQAGV